MTDEPTTPPPTEPDPAEPPFSTPEMVKIQAEIAATRAELAATVDQLATRLRPGNQAKKVLSDAVDPGATPTARRRAWVVLGAAAAVTVVVAVGVVRKIVR